MKKTTKVVIGVAAGIAMLSVVVMSAWLVMRQNSDDVTIGVGNLATGAVVKPVTLAELPDGEVDLERVQELYERFEISPLQGFYVDELLTEVFGAKPERGRLEMVLNQAENWTGEAVRAKYREMFGEEIVLSEEKYGEDWGDRRLASGMKYAAYDAVKDEFVELEGGTDSGGRYIRRLEQAEKEGDKVYLYERVLTVRCQPDPRFDEDGNQIGDGSSCTVLEAAATCGTPDIMWTGEMKGMTDEEILNEATERGLGLVKWTFELVDGRYVYQGMERDYDSGDDE